MGSRDPAFDMKGREKFTHFGIEEQFATALPDFYCQAGQWHPNGNRHPFSVPSNPHSEGINIPPTPPFPPFLLNNGEGRISRGESIGRAAVLQKGYGIADSVQCVMFYQIVQVFNQVVICFEV